MRIEDEGGGGCTVSVGIAGGLGGEVGVAAMDAIEGADDERGWEHGRVIGGV